MNAWLSMLLLCGPADWPQFAGPSRDYRVADIQLDRSAWKSTGPEVRWHRPLGPGYSGVVADGELLIACHRDGDEDVVSAFDPSDGELLWRHRDMAPALPEMLERYGYGPHSTPLLREEGVYFVGGTGHLLALDRDGEVLWKVDLWSDLGGTFLERGYAASPLGVGDRIVLPVGGEGQAVVAFRASTGEVVWKAGDGDAAYASACLRSGESGGEVAALLKDEFLGLDARTGALRWRQPVNSSQYAICATPVACPSDGWLFLSRPGATRLTIVRAGEEVRVETEWVRQTLGSQEHNLLLAGTRILGSNNSTTLTALSEGGGARVFRTRQLADASHILLGDSLVSLTEDGELCLSELGESGPTDVRRALLLQGTCWSIPAYMGGMLYVRDDRELLALELPER